MSKNVIKSSSDLARIIREELSRKDDPERINTLYLLYKDMGRRLKNNDPLAFISIKKTLEFLNVEVDPKFEKELKLKYNKHLN